MNCSRERSDGWNFLSTRGRGSSAAWSPRRCRSTETTKRSPLARRASPAADPESRGPTHGKQLTRDVAEMKEPGINEKLLDLVEKSSLREEKPFFEIGDTVDVHCRILEGEKERIQVFSGIVIARSGNGTGVNVCRPPHRAGRGRGAEVPLVLAANRQGRGQRAAW